MVLATVNPTRARSLAFVHRCAYGYAALTLNEDKWREMHEKKIKKKEKDAPKFTNERGEKKPGPGAL